MVLNNRHMMLINNLSCKEWNKLLRRLQIGKTLLAQEISRPSKHRYGGLASYMIMSLRCEKKTHLPKHEKKRYKGKPWFVISCKGGC